MGKYKQITKFLLIYNNVYSLPTDVFLLARKQDILIHYTILTELIDKSLLFMNKRLPLEIQRFFLAEAIVCSAFNRNDFDSAEVQEIALNILMDDDLIIEAYKTTKDAKELAMMFQTSTQIMRYKLTSLKLI